MAKKVQMQRFVHHHPWTPVAEFEVSSSTDRPFCFVEDDQCSEPKPPYRKACERPPTTVAKRNARERKRVHTVNQGFLILKEHLPSLRHKTKRVSKLRILRAAIHYIYALSDLLEATPYNTITEHHVTYNQQYPPIQVQHYQHPVMYDGHNHYGTY